MTYCLPAWGAKKTQDLSDLKKLVKKTWSKIGQRRMHTNHRISQYKILNFTDELRLSELKILWRWEKNKIPLGLKNIIAENNNRALRNRMFIKDQSWKNDSISFRLASRATKEIKEIEIARSKNGLKNKIKNTCFLIDYNSACRMRNCFICSNA